MPPVPWAKIHYNKEGNWDMASGAHEGMEHLLYEVKKIVVGQDHFLERVMVALLAGVTLLCYTEDG